LYNRWTFIEKCDTATSGTVLLHISQNGMYLGLINHIVLNGACLILVFLKNRADNGVRKSYVGVRVGCIVVIAKNTDTFVSI